MSSTTCGAASRYFVSCMLACALGALLTVAPAKAAQGANANANAGDSAKPARITGAFPQAGEKYDGKLTIVFDGPIKVAGAAADQPTTASLLFDPPLEGQVRVGPNFLALTAAKNTSLPSAVTRLKLTSRVKSAGGQPIAPPAAVTLTDFEFQPTAASVLAQSTTHTLVGLTFNAPVKPSDLKKKLTIKDPEGHALAFSVGAGNDSQVVEIDIPRAKIPAAKGFIAPGLPETEERFATSRGFTVDLVEAQLLEVGAPRWLQTDLDGQVILLRFSQPVDLDKLRPCLSVEDVSTTAPRGLDVKLSSPNNNSFHVLATFHASDPDDIKLRLAIRDGFMAEGGAWLKNGWTGAITFRRRLSLDNENWSTDGGVTSLLLGFNYPIHLDDFRAHFSIEPAAPGMTIVQEDSRRFRIRGQLKLSTAYHAKLSVGLRFGASSTLKEPMIIASTSPSPESVHPSVSFPGKETYYWPRRYGNVVPVDSRGCDKLDVTLYRVFANNVTMAADSIYERNGNYSRELADRWSEEAGHATIPIKSDPLKQTTTAVMLDRLTSAPMLGVYSLHVTGLNSKGESTDNSNDDDDNGYRYRRRRRYRSYYSDDDNAHRLLMMTNLGVLAHWQDDQLAVFAHDLFTMAAAKGARVRVWSNKNQVIGDMRADAQGVAVLGKFDSQKGLPAALTVESGKDYTFIKLESVKPDGLPSDKIEAPYLGDGYDAFLYADRDLYRPGETVHLRALVRQRYSHALAGAPMTVEVLKPDGVELTEKTIELSPQGTLSMDVPTQKSYPTGGYKAQIFVPGSDKQLGEYLFHVEEFVPNRMKAELTLPVERWVAGAGPFKVQLAAKHLFGSPAADRAAKASLSFDAGHDFPQWPGYRFGNESHVDDSTVDLGETQTDAKGVAKFEFDGAAVSKATQPLSIRATGNVAEPGGRTVGAALISGAWFPSADCLGVQLVPSTTGAQAVAARVAAVRPDGSASALTMATIKLEHAAWDYNVRGYYGRQEADFSDRYETVKTASVALAGGKGQVSLDAPEWGNYRVTVSAPGNPQFSTAFFFAYGGRPQVTDSAKPALVRLTLDRKDYKPGQTARLRIESPFDGTAVVVVQGEQIFKMITAPVAKQSSEVELKVSADWYPCAWIEATVIHPVEDGKKQVYPRSSFAMAGLRVIDPARQIQVSLPGLPAEILPATPREVTVQTVDGSGRPVAAAVTLAAVDEGIHGITNYANPDPLGWLERKRRPDFSYAHYYDLIADKWTPPAPGGDGDDSGKSLGRQGMNWIKTVALWSGEVHTDADGKATIKLDVPEFSGQLRFVVVAASSTGSGATHAGVFVRRPWMLQTSMPRFLLPGDRAKLTATLYNTTATSATVALDMAASGTMKLALADGAASKTLKQPEAKAQAKAKTAPARFTTQLALRPKSDVSVKIPVVAADAPGQGWAFWSADVKSADGRGQRLRENAPIPVNEPAAFERRPTTRILNPGEEATFSASEFRQDDWTGLEIGVGADPLWRLEPALASLVAYPYGCVEQTTSRLMSLYLLRKQKDLASNAAGRLGDLDLYVKSGIERLWSMQTASGGLAFWPGETTPYDYGTIYAMHFLTLAKNGRELPIDANDYAVLKQYVKRLAQDATDDSAPGVYQRAYAIYVLALAGDADAADLVTRFETLMLPREARYLLAAALAVTTKDGDRARVFLASAQTVPMPGRQFDGALCSPARNEAVELMALTAMQPAASDPKTNDPKAKIDAIQTEHLAQNLERELENPDRLTTQENAMAITALCAWMERLSPNVDKAAAEIRWGHGARASIKGRESFRAKLAGPGCQFTVVNRGAAPLYVAAAAEGVPLVPTGGPASDGATVGRRMLDAQGQEVDPASLRQGESYVVELTIAPQRELKKFVLADLLPAGLEIQNPRLDADAMAGFKLPAASDAEPSRMEPRDDRLVLFFDDLNARDPSQPYHFYFLVDAVTPGTFLRPALTGECMYDPSVHARAASETVTVKD